MKRSFCLLLSIVAVFIFGAFSMSLAGTHEAKPQAEATPKITAKDAKHTVLFAYPGSTVEKCEMVKGKDHTNWAVSVVRGGTTTSIQVQVDGVTGQIIP
ncbi:MAG TPA: PepSY domain-containing protein [Chthoniobacterales bacterium]|nr:PepSY domain-containing protein [Chthoniobacterales bacterium]